MMWNTEKINLALVCTTGGHFEQMSNLVDFYKCYNHFWITNRNKQTETQFNKERMYYIEMAQPKRPWTYLYHLGPVRQIFAMERPTHVVSTGSGRTAFIPFLLSRLARIQFIYVDTFSRVNGHSKFGTFMLKTGHKIYTQWQDPRNANALYIGPVFKQRERRHKPEEAKYVFVTVGTRVESFRRLLQGVEDLVKRGVIKEDVIIQAGHTKYQSSCAHVFDFCGSEEMEELILNARYVITQESAGIGTQCLKTKTAFIVMPREYQYGELPTKSDMREDLHYKLEELGYTKVARNVDELEKAIGDIGNLKVGLAFDNSLAIATLHKAVQA